MSRSRSGVDLVAWGVGLGLPALLLLGVFSTLPYATMTGHWPLGIGPTEVTAYRHWFDQRGSDADTSARAERFTLEGVELPDDSKWHAYAFAANGKSDSVHVRRMRTVDGGLVIKFNKDELFRGQHEIALIPATIASLQAKYEEILAGELDLLAPEVSFVELSAPGVHGLYLKEERIDAGFMEKHRLTDAALFTWAFADGRPEQAFPAFDIDTLAGPIATAKILDVLDGGAAPTSIIDADDAAAYLLAVTIADRKDLLLDEGLFAYRWTTGRIAPLFRARRTDNGEVGARPFLGNIFTRLMDDDAFRTTLANKRERLVEIEWRLKERFAAMDQAWLPVLVQGDDPGPAQAEADRIKEWLLERLRSVQVTDLFAGNIVPVVPHQFADLAAGALVRPLSRDTIAARLGGELIGDSIVLRRGKYVIEEDLVLPPGTALVLEKSVRMEIAPGRSVLVQGPLIVRGTDVNPVFVRPLREGSAFGSFAVSLADARGARCELRGLRISGGSEARINGFYHSGMLSIHGAGSVLMENCEVDRSHGEDAVNIKRGHALIRDCVFQDGHADLVDLDYVKGEVRDCIFRNGREDSNGDGLDVSGSHVLITGCSFVKLLDKGISVGEVSEVLVTNCSFTGDRLGMAVKDLSIAHVDACTFIENSTVFGVYRKKPIYGGARLLLYYNTFSGNLRDREVDALSAITQQKVLDPKVKQAFGLP